MKHTPGPWRTVILDGERRAIISDSSHDVGDIKYVSPADAALIASAPLLLAALRRVTHPMAGDDDLDYALRVIEAATGQATV